MKSLRIAPDLALPLDVVTEKLAFLGRTGSGKSYAAQKLAEEMYAAEAQFVVLDPVGIWYGLRLAADGKRPGLEVPVLGGLHGDIPLEAGAGALIANLVVDRGVSMVLDVSQFESDADKARFAHAFADRFFFRKKAAPSAVHVFIEEAQEFVPQNPQREEARMLHAFTRLEKLGRNFGIGVSLISQRPQEVNKKALNQTELLFAFQMTGPQERKTIEGWIAEKGIDEDIAGELPKLARGEPHVWSPAWLKISKRVAIAAKWTFDASSTPTVGKKADARPLAPIDLERLRKDMAATIEKAKAEDPRELRRRIAELEGEIRNKKLRLTQEKPASAPNRVEVPILKDAQVKRLEYLAAQVEKILGKFDDWRAAFEARGEDLRAAAAEISATIRAKLPPLTIAFAHDKLVYRHEVRARKSGVSPQDSGNFPQRGRHAANLPKGEQLVLTAIAQHDGGITREQATVLTGYKRSTRDAYIQRLREKGLVEDDDRGGLVVTSDGVHALGPDFAPLPTGDALLQHWLGRLPEGERRILEVLVAAHPKAVDRDVVSEKSGYQRSTRDAYLQRLGARKLVTSHGRGEVRAAEELFGT